MICFVDYRISNEELVNLKKLNLHIIKVPQCKTLYPAIDGHVDIQINIIHRLNKKVIINRNISEEFRHKLLKFEIDYIESKYNLGKNYPNNVILNAFNDNNYFIHNTKYTDPNLLDNISDKKIINIKQGYTKCSILPIADNAVITNDAGIHKTLSKYDFDVLLLPPGDILLPGLNYGFIGGVGGLISKDKLGLFGNLNSYVHGNLIKDFLLKYNVTPIYLKEGKLIDRGSLFIL